MKEQDLKDFQLQIVRLAKTEEEVRNILWELTRTDWESVWDSDKESCDICRQLFQRRKMVAVKRRFYCEPCAFTGFMRSCLRCWGQFYASVFSPNDYLCFACQSQICEVCQISTLPPHENCQPRVICQMCLATLSLRSDWEHRELRKISTHISHSEGHLSLREWVSTLRDFSWKCAYCMDASYEQIDHFIPISKSGYTAKYNCVPACKECNKRKGQRIPEHVIGIPKEALTRVQAYLQQFSSNSEISLKPS